MPDFKAVGRIKARYLNGEWKEFNPPLNATWYGSAYDSVAAYMLAYSDLIPNSHTKGEILEVIELTPQTRL